MPRPHLPLNALRAFEAAARHLSFTNAAIELCVTQAALSHQVKALEDRLGKRLFRRLPRGLALTDEGLALLPSLSESFDRISGILERITEGSARETLTVGVVSTFAVGWLVPRLSNLEEACPNLELRLLTNNNRVDLAAEGLDCAIKYGDGAWHGMDAMLLLPSMLTPLCAPSIAARLASPADLPREKLLRSYRSDEWPAWFAKAGVAVPLMDGPVFDSSLAMVSAAEQGLGVALAPAWVFARQLDAGIIVRPFSTVTRSGGYWLTWLKSREKTNAVSQFAAWLRTESDLMTL